MDILAAKIGANMAKRELVENGQVGSMETKTKEIIPETVVSYDYNQMGAVLGFIPVAGAKYTVEIDGKKYTSTAKAGTMQGQSLISLGNGWLYGMGDTGELWNISYIPSYSMTALTLFEGKGASGNYSNLKYTGPVTIAITETSETIHSIDPKFLPGVCLPVVELSTAFAGGATLSAEECALLDAAYEGNTPVIIKCNIALTGYELTDCVAVWNRAVSAGIPVFTNQIGTIMLQLVNMGSAWQCNVQ